MNPLIEGWLWAIIALMSEVAVIVWNLRGWGEVASIAIYLPCFTRAIWCFLIKARALP